MAKTNRAEREQLIQKQKFVALYTTGTDRTKGNAAECNRLLGTEFDFCDQDIRRLIEEDGVLVPACNKVQLLPADVDVVVTKVQSLMPIAAVIPAQVLETADSSLHQAAGEQEAKWRAGLETVDAEPVEDWCAKYKELVEPVLAGAAAGTVKISAAQTRIIAMITERCFGRVKDDEAKPEASGVLLLPMIGSGSSSMICPRCGYVHEETSNESQG